MSQRVILGQLKKWAAQQRKLITVENERIECAGLDELASVAPMRGFVTPLGSRDAQRPLAAPSLAVPYRGPERSAREVLAAAVCKGAGKGSAETKEDGAHFRSDRSAVPAFEQPPAVASSGGASSTALKQMLFAAGLI